MLARSTLCSLLTCTYFSNVIIVFFFFMYYLLDSISWVLTQVQNMWKESLIYSKTHASTSRRKNNKWWDSYPRIFCSYLFILSFMGTALLLSLKILLLYILEQFVILYNQFLYKQNIFLVFYRYL